MTRILAALAALVVLPAASPVRHADAAARKALEGQYRAFTRAFQARRMESVRAMLTDDFKVKTPDGREMGRDQVLADFQRQAEGMQNVRWDRTITALKLDGDTAVVTVRGKLRGEMRDPRGAVHRLALDSLVNDTWARSGGVWRLRASDTREMRLSVDGKPVARPGAPAPAGK